MSVIYEELNKYSNVDYDIVSEEYRTLNNIEYYYLGVKLRINKTSRIKFAMVAVSTNIDYKFEALTVALSGAYLIMENIDNRNNMPNMPNMNNQNGINIQDNMNQVNNMYQQNNMQGIPSNNINNMNNINNVNNMPCGNVNNMHNQNNMPDMHNQNNIALSKNTIAKIINFKKIHNIHDNVKFLEYLKSWDSSIVSVKDLTEQSALSFLQWASK